MDADDAERAVPEVVGPPWVRGLDAPPGTAWTRADALRVGDLVSIGDDHEDRSARIVSVERGDSPDRLRVRLAFELDGCPCAAAAGGWDESAARTELGSIHAKIRVGVWELPVPGSGDRRASVRRPADRGKPVETHALGASRETGRP